MTTSISVLLLEDDPTDAELIRELLAGHFDCKITQVQTRADFTNALESGDFDLILSDYRLPSFDGVSALKVALGARPGLPFIFISGAMGEEIAIETLKMGATDYVLKSRLGRLVPSVQRALRETQERADRQRAQEELRASEIRYRTFVDQATDAFFLLDDHSTILDVNRQACDSLGYSREELIGKHHSDFDIDLDDRSIERLTQRITAGETITFETRHRRKHDTSFPVEVRVSQFEQGGGRRFLCLVRDITERKRAEAALQDRETKIRRLVDANIIGIFIARLDGDSPIIEANDAFLRMLGYNRDDFAAGMTMAQLRPPETLERTRQSLDEMRASSKLQPYEKTYLRKDGSHLPVLVGAAVFAEDKNEGVGFVVDLTEQKRAENDLRQSEARLQVAQRIAHVGWWERDFTTRHVSLSDEVCRIFGLQPVDLPEWHDRWLQLIHPEDRPRVDKAAAAALLRDGKRYDVEYRVVRPDSTVRIVHSQGDVTWDESGKPLRQFGVLQDITELRRTEQELHESEERFRSFINHATDGFFVLDAQQTVLDVNRQACESLGYSREELLGMCPRDFDSGLDQASIARLGERITAGETVTFETLHRRKDGTVFPVEIRARQFQRGAHRFRLSLVRDITERKRVEEALRRSEAYLAEAQRLSHTGTIVFNAAGPVHWSDESYRIWALDPRQGLPDLETMLQRIHPDDREIKKETFELLRRNEKYVIEFRIVLPDGKIKHLESTGYPLLSANGEPQMIATHVDVTERKRAQAEHERLRQLELELAHMNRLSIMGELTASLAHEVLHPIATARNNARAGTRFLEMTPPKLHEVKEALACIVRDSDRAKGIVDRMRDQAKKAPARREPFNLNEAIEQVIEMVQSTIANNKVSVQANLKVVRPICGDRVQLQQVVLNLILNAVEAMNSTEATSRELSISATTQGQTGEILVAVRDSGPGIDPERLDRVFAPFYTTKSTGMGMGLSICRSIIGAHGGRLWVEANQEGRGAVFKFTVPAAQEDL